jgi:hypothetical protein
VFHRIVRRLKNKKEHDLRERVGCLLTVQEECSTINKLNQQQQ